jgi:hypothetical protein
MSYVAIAAAAAAAIGGAVSASGGSGGSSSKRYSAKHTMKTLDAMGNVDPLYTGSPYAQNTLGLAQTLLNSRMAGVQRYTNNIYGAQANTLSGINRNATDSSQALALAAGVQGQTDASFGNLQQMEAQDYNNKVANLNQANQGMTAEGDKIYDSIKNKWQDQVNIAMTTYKIRTKKRQDTARVIGGAFTGLGSVLGSVGGGKGG